MKLIHCSHPPIHLVVLCLVSLLSALTPLAAHAALIPVDTTDYGVTVDGNCSLVEAILAANTNNGGNGCAAGNDSPVDTIVLGANLTYTLPTSYTTYLGPTGLPAITSTVVISGNNATIQRASDEQFGLMYVAPVSGTLTLLDLSLRNGNATIYGGAIANTGTLVIVNSKIVSNTAGEGGGGVANLNGAATLINSQLFSNSIVSFASGAGIYNITGTLFLTGTQVYANVGGKFGGGIANINSSAVITGSHIFANYTASSVFAGEPAEGYGGGIYNKNSVMGLSDSTVTANGAGNNGGGGGGGAIYNDQSTAGIVNSALNLNQSPGVYFYVESLGGAIGNVNGSTLLITGTEILSNSASYGGGIGLRQSRLRLYDSTVGNNKSIHNGNTLSINGSGGGIYGEESQVEVINSRLVSNTADGRGGGLYGIDSTVTVSSSHVLTNSADYIYYLGEGSGGGLFNDGDGSLWVANSYIISNSGSLGAGGLDNAGIVTITQSSVIANSGLRGAGLGNPFSSSRMTILDSLILSNSHTVDDDFNVIGGGLYNYGSAFITNTDIIANGSGGVLTPEEGHLSIFNSRILSNQGGGIIVQSGLGKIEQSCIVGNSDTAVVGLAREIPQKLDARDNWWGTVDGPSGAAPGSGDSVDKHVLYSPFLTSAPAGCPSATGIELEVTMSSDKTSASVGEIITYSYQIKNTGQVTLTINAVDNKVGAIPGLAGVLNLKETRNTIASYQVKQSDLPGPLVNSVTVTGTDALGQTITRTVSATVTITPFDDTPKLTVTVTPNKNEAIVGEKIVYSYRIKNTGAVSLTIGNVVDDYAGVITGLAGLLLPGAKRSANGSYVVKESDLPGPLVNTLTVSATDSVANTILRDASSSVNLSEGEGVKDFVVNVSADKSTAVAGEEILYTYHVTNTGTLSLTISNAVDNYTGVVAGLVGPLAPGASRTATAVYAVKESDLPGPLVNDVVVTANDSFGNAAVHSDTTWVDLLRRFTINLPGIRRQE